MSVELHIREGEVWINNKTGNRYNILGIAICSDNGPRDGTKCIIYSSGKDDLYVRGVNEFLVKFTKEEPERKSA